VSGHLHSLAAFPWEKNCQYPLNRRLDVAAELVWMFWKRQKSLSHQDFNPRLFSPQPILYTDLHIPSQRTTLYQNAMRSHDKLSKWQAE